MKNFILLLLGISFGFVFTANADESDKKVTVSTGESIVFRFVGVAEGDDCNHLSFSTDLELLNKEKKVKLYKVNPQFISTIVECPNMQTIDVEVKSIWYQTQAGETVSFLMPEWLSVETK